MKIKIDAKVMGDLNEFITQKFREAEISDSDQEKDIDAFDYIKNSKKMKKLTKA